MNVRQYTEYRVYYRYGVNSGTLVGTDPERMVRRFEAETSGPIGAYKVEERTVTVLEGEWFDIPVPKGVR